MLFLDIETAPACTLSDFGQPTIKMPKSYKVGTPAYREEYARRGRKAWLDTALDSSRGRIVAIGAAWDQNDPIAFTGPDESGLLFDFHGWLFDWGICAEEWVTWYGDYFDCPWIRHRAYVHGLVDLARRVPSKRNEGRDLHRIWAGTDTRGRYRLADVARCLAIPCKEKLPPGRNVAEHMADLFAHGRFDEIGAYAIDDVLTTRAVFYRMEG